MEAAVILARCSRGAKLYGMRTQKMEDGDWWRTWAFPIDENRAHKEGYDTTPIRGNLKNTSGYPGCPYCGTYNFAQCGKCSKLTCYNGEKQLKCGWCGIILKNFETARDGFELSGGAF